MLTDFQMDFITRDKQSKNRSVVITVVSKAAERRPELINFLNGASCVDFICKIEIHSNGLHSSLLSVLHMMASFG